MFGRIFFFSFFTLFFSACSDVQQKYRDTTELETPPQVIVAGAASADKPFEAREKPKVFVFLDDTVSPPVLKIKKLFDRSWNLIDQTLTEKEIEVTDKNRDEGVFFLKYNPDDHSDKHVFGNIRMFIFEPEYQNSEYKLSLAWRETETEVRAEMIRPENIVLDEDEEEPEDGSEKLIQALYDAIMARLTENKDGH